MSKITCIDVSEFQIGVDYNKVKADGIEAVIIRAGYGREASQKDKEFETHYHNAKAAGLKVGAYWYSYAKSVENAVLEAKACLECVKGKSFDLPIFYDLEDESQLNLSKATLTKMAEAFCEEIKKAGYTVGIYANLTWFENHLDYNCLINTYFIWLAQYNSIAELKCDIWQNSSDSHINGVRGSCDTNIIYNNDIFDKNKVNKTEKPPNGNSEIKAVQHWLNSNYDANLDEDGIYGPLTQKALVKALQTELNKQYGANLIVDGIFGQKTKKAVRNLSKGLQGNLTKILQGFLICNGYGTNGFDGFFGNGTEKAVKAYQKREGLAVDGIAGKDTFTNFCC